MTAHSGPADEGSTASIPVTVSVSDDHNLDEVAEELRRAGMEIENRFEPLHLLAGRIRSDQLAALRRIPGVDAVDVERNFRLPPPDSNLQ